MDRSLLRRSAHPWPAVLVAVSMLLSACGGTQSAPLPGAASQPTSASSPAASPRPAGSPVAGGSSVAACPPTGSANALTGAGATFPAPLYTRWFSDYARLCNVQINYQAIGSGGGIQQHTQRTVDFGASDGILTEAQFTAATGTVMIPMTAGSEAIVVNLPGIARGQLKLSPDTLAGIFLGEITRWNDSRVSADNAGVSLPNQDIVVVHRSDGSGTTNIFTTYLSEVSAAWKDRVGAGNSVQWPTGLGGEGNAGVAGQVRQLPGAIGYVELAYAAQNSMVWTALRNQAGQFVEPSIAATTAAMEGVTVPDNTQVMIVNTSNPQGYPIAGLTWILVYENQTDAAKARTLGHFLWWALHDGQATAPELEYAPLSPTIVTKAEALVRRITAGGQPVLSS
jgi:phosphate transport system substrate-binding protein